MSASSPAPAARLQRTPPAIGVMGVGCRLPGAADYAALRDLILDGRCAVSEIPSDRFVKARYFHPNPGMPGKTYTFAAGIIDNIWDFDPAPFGISPREATQMDPQQRLLLQVVWEAIEDAGIPHTNLAGQKVGVFIGASSTDHRDQHPLDTGSTDPYMMTGNTMSLISNRISYIFDFKGPSFTVDTACSSSLVAMESAVSALKSGKIDTAIVGGVNALLSPFSFIGFSSAGMLSREGLCRAFDARGAGYVRAEGAVALVLQRTDLAPESIRMPRRRAEIIAAATNSDGKTVGVSLPSDKTQGLLLKNLYAEAKVDPNDLAFFEAHGTGTRVGDPAEARAIGENLARHRKKPLLIGSIKSNIGHLEPAAGLAGVLKAIIGFESGFIPPSLHFEQPNPDIPFADLKLEVVTKKTALPKSRKARYAGISTFGFGGTNAHVILREVKPQPRRETADATTQGGGMLTLSAHGVPALRAIAGHYANYLKAHPDLSIATLAEAVRAQRPLLADCLAVRANSPAHLVDVLEHFAATDASEVLREGATLATGRADRAARPIAFVFNGNGAQFAGMGWEEYSSNPGFRAHIDRLSAEAEPVFGWRVADMLSDPALAGKLESTAIAQPLLFILQIAIAACLKDLGIEARVCFGHSVGEIAAATIAGALTIEQGIRVIHARSQQQETTRGRGRMAVSTLSKAEAEPILADIRSSGHVIALAANNAPRAITVSGEHAAIEAFVLVAKQRGFAGKILDLDYGFHCPLMDPVESGIRRALADLRPTKSAGTFISTVTGKTCAGNKLTADYWWRNIREPVRFMEAAQEAFDQGARIFIEIGPRALFRNNLRETFSDASETIAIIETLKQPARASALNTEDAERGRHCELAALTAMASGAMPPVKARKFPAERHITLPGYPWQNRAYRRESSPETVDSWQKAGDYHMLLGHPGHSDAHSWRSHIDAHVLPMLGDHIVDGKTILPGAAYAEMALSAAKSYFGTDHVEVRDMDISRAIELSDDKMIETRTEISTDASSITILSRQRLSDDDWSLNATARIARLTENHPLTPRNAADESRTLLLNKKQLYELSVAHGLEYGPTFARAAKVELGADDHLMVTYEPPLANRETLPGAAPFLLNPSDLDIAFHGLIALYNTDQPHDIQRGFIPIRFGCLRVAKPGVRAHSARIDIKRLTPRNIAAEFQLYDADGGVIAELEDARFRAVSLVQHQRLSDYTYHFRPQTSPHPLLLPLAGDAPASAVARSPDGPPLPKNCFLNQSWPGSEARLLLAAAAQRCAFDALQSLATNRRINLQQLLERGRLLPEDLVRVNAFLGLCESFEASRSIADQNEWELAATIDLPESADILAAVMRDHPEWSAECTMLSHVMWHLRREGFARPEKPSLFEPATLDQHRTSGPETDGHVTTIAHMVAAVIESFPPDRPFRIVEIGNAGGALTLRLLPLLDKGRGALVTCGSDRRTLGFLKLQTLDLPNVSVITSEEIESLAALGAPVDIVVSANGLHRESDAEALLRHAAKAMHRHGRLILSETQPTPLHDVLFAFEANWYQRALNPEFPLCAERTIEEWRHVLEGSGYASLTIHAADDEGLPAFVMHGLRQHIATKPASNVVVLRDKQETDHRPVESPPHRLLMLTRNERRAFAERLEKATPREVEIVDLSEADGRLAMARFSAMASQGRSFDVLDLTLGSDPLDQTVLSGHLKRLNALLNGFEPLVGTLWIAAIGGARTIAGLGSANPNATAIWTYARTVRNEYPELTVRTFDIAEGLSDEAAVPLLASHLCSHLASGIATSAAPSSAWSEAILAAHGCVELVADFGLPAIAAPAARPLEGDLASTLHFEDLAGVDELAWQHRQRQAPGSHQVEVEVVATGLNFRDVMWTLGILPDEALEDGFAGPTLGFECAGRISAVGADVANLRIGDPVLALGPACFSSHVLVSDVCVVPLQAELDLVAAATIPVTFLTAYYALHALARLEKDEWVLIHGGAGGVGLAAIQIAQWQGAQIIATAGTQEKRDLLRTLGVDHVLDSRSLDFVDDVRRITKEGIDCVLNSLSGEAMERGIELLKPFGRFLELGKRDYYGNTKIGLRPFRRNITYFGIDADQLLAEKPELARQLFRELMALFENGTLAPLLYRKFDGSAISDAFRLMQKSGHIGKIVVTPTAPETIAARAAEKPVTFSGDGHFLVVGGLGGFGMEIIPWLSRKGARQITVISRSGTVTSEQQAVFDSLAAAGTRVSAVACDVADATALSAVLAALRQSAPIKGVIHAAMVLRDGLIASMSDADIDAVLNPKVKGAELLHELTKSDPIETFILFSSITTIIGNPGQANYVAANGYMEGLARMRRIEGLPALAIGWGAITDVGYLARHRVVADTIAKRSGTLKFTAGQALRALERIISLDDGSPARAFAGVAPMNWAVAKGGLAILRTAPFLSFSRRADQSTQRVSETLDLAALIAGKTEPEARAIICAILAKEVSLVLRTPVEDVNVKRPLTDLGMDSLMGVELRMTAQQKLGIDIPLASIANGVSVEEIAKKILMRLNSGVSEQGSNLMNELSSYHIDSEDYSDQIKTFASQLKNTDL